jgi:hypothetical protein
MSEPTPPDGPRSAGPPRVPEPNAAPEPTVERDDDTPLRAERPVFDTTVEHPTTPGGPPSVRPLAPPVFGQAMPISSPAGPPPAGPPPGTYQLGPPPAGSQPPGQYQPPAGVSPTQRAPGGAYSAGPPGGPPFGGAGAPADESPKKNKSGLLAAGLVALVVALAVGLGFVLTQTGGGEETDASSTTQEQDEPSTTEPVVTDPVVPEVTAVPDPTTTTAAALIGSVEGLFTRIEAHAEVIPDEQLITALEQLGLAEGDNPVSTADAVLNLCAAIAVDVPVAARVSWARDSIAVFDGPSRSFSSPADGNCINNNGEPLADGAYEAFFADVAGGESGVALFTVGAATREQEFLNDSDTELCSVDLGPVTSGFYQTFELATDEPVAIGESIIIDIADVEHEARGVDCSGTAQESVFFLPSDGPVSLVSGALDPPTSAPAAFISDAELQSLGGEVASVDVTITPGSPEEDAVFTVLRDPDSDLRLATTDPSLTLCAAWNVPGLLEAEIVWEFNRNEIARFPITAANGGIGLCVPPGGATFGEGTYQVYLQRGGIFSAVETFTVGREQTQLAFVNDTGVPICEVGFSPNLTNWYSFFEFSESSAFGAPLEPGQAFTIAAPLIESDIQSRDCDGDLVSEVFDIAPTDQTLSLNTGT